MNFKKENHKNYMFDSPLVLSAAIFLVAAVAFTLLYWFVILPRTQHLVKNGYSFTPGFVQHDPLSDLPYNCNDAAGTFNGPNDKERCNFINASEVQKWCTDHKDKCAGYVKFNIGPQTFYRPLSAAPPTSSSGLATWYKRD